MAAAHQNIDDLADFLIAATHRVDLAFACLLGQVDGEFLQSFLATHGGRGHRTGVFAGLRESDTAAVLCTQFGFGAVAADLVELLGQVIRLDPFELLGDAIKRIAQSVCLQHAQHQVAGAHLGFAKLQRGVDPGPLDGVFDIL